MEVKIVATISERLREAMDIRHMKQVDLSNKTGIDKGSISQYLSGKYAPKGDKLYKLAVALKVSSAWLSGFNVPMEDKPQIVKNNNELVLTDREKELILAYRNHPAMQEAVDKLLGVPAADVDLIVEDAAKTVQQINGKIQKIRSPKSQK